MLIETELSQQIEVSKKSQQQLNNDFEINKSIIDMFLNAGCGLKARMCLHSIASDTVWYICKYLIKEGKHEYKPYFFKEKDSASVEFLSKNGNILYVLIYENLIDELEKLVNQ